MERDLQEERFEREQNGVPSTECVVCMAACVSTVLLPCGHLCLCTSCAASFQKLRTAPESKGISCPLCRLPVDNMARVFLPVEEPLPKTKAAAVAPSKSPCKSDAIGDEKVPTTPTGSDSSGSANETPGEENESVAVQVSPSLRRTGSQPLHPQPRVYSRSASMSAQPRLRINASLAAQPIPPWTPTRRPAQPTADAENDVVMRPSRSIIRPPTTPPASDYIEVRGSPAERPQNYDFVLPGAYVPDCNPLFARTWDGALRVRAE